MNQVIILKLNKKLVTVKYNKGAFKKKHSFPKVELYFLVMVKYCTPGSVSAVSSHLRSGDELLSINGTCILSLTQNQIRSLLQAESVRIIFLSWPGCLV